MTKTSRTLALLPLFAAAYAFAPSTASAATLSVGASNCDYTTIQAAVDASAPGDVIDVQAGTYGRVAVAAGKDVTIQGHNQVTIDAGTANSALRVRSGAHLQLSGVTVSGVSGTTKKAGILNEGELDLDTVTVELNDAMFGGIANYGTLTMCDHSVISNNESTSYFAGGVNNIGGLVDIDNSTLIGNSGWNGGAASNLGGGDMYIRASSISANDGYLGGGVHNSFSFLYFETGVTFTSNHATSLGGGWSNHNIGGLVSGQQHVSYANNSTGSGQSVDFYDVN